MPHPAGLRGSQATRTTSSARSSSSGASSPGLRRAVVKLNESFSGEGNAIFRFPRDGDAASRCARRWAAWSSPCASESHETYFRKFARMGGIVEEFIDAPIKLSPSAQLRTTPRGEVGGDLDARPDSRRAVRADLSGLHVSRRTRTIGAAIQDAGIAVGHVLASHGVVSRFGVDFLVSRQRSRPSRGQMHGARDQPARARARRTRSSRCSSSPAAGSIPTPGCSCRSAAAPSTTWRPTTCARRRYRGVLPEDLIDIVTNNGLHYSYRTESGVLFHLIGALSEWGKLGRHRHRQQPRRGQRALSAHARRARSRSRPRASEPQPRQHEETRMKIGLMVGREHSFPHGVHRSRQRARPAARHHRRVRQAGRARSSTSRRPTG